MKDSEIIADNLSKAGWSLGWVSAVDSKGRTIWIADAHRDDGKRFVVRADEKVTTFVELEPKTRHYSRLCRAWQRIGLATKQDFFHPHAGKRTPTRRRPFPPLGSSPLPDPQSQN